MVVDVGGWADETEELWWVVVDVGGWEDETEKLEWDGGARAAQLEPAPENCFWQVAGSHQAGPVSHCRKGEIRHGRCCVRIH